ncbi:hypothetical protein AVEN_247228-1, partial [Araneus ventricosus]
ALMSSRVFSFPHVRTLQSSLLNHIPLHREQGRSLLQDSYHPDVIYTSGCKMRQCEVHVKSPEENMCRR